MNKFPLDEETKNFFLKKEEFYTNLIENQHEEFLKLSNDTDWKFLKTQDKCSLYSKKYNDSKFVIFKCTIFIDNTTPEKYYQHVMKQFNESNFTEIHRRNNMNKTFIQHIKYNKDFDMYIEQIAAKTGSIFVADREFVNIRHKKILNNSIIVSWTPLIETDENKIKIYDKNVRGKMRYCHIFEKKKNGVFHLSMIHSNPRGWIPSVFYNNMAGSTVICSSIVPKKIYEEKKLKK